MLGARIRRLVSRLGWRRAPAMADLPAYDVDKVQELRARLADRCFFVTGSGRSGTTSCLRILGTSADATVVSEPRPRFTREVHEHRWGRLPDPRPLIWRHRAPSLGRALDGGQVYGEKDQQVYGWLPYYHELFGGRFVFTRRDGRDVVRSFMDYHTLLNGSMYREAEETRDLTLTARATRDQPDAVLEEVEWCRPRPLPSELDSARWRSWTRVGLIAWYWAHTTRVIQRDLHRIGYGAWREINYSGDLDPGMFDRLASFLRVEPPPLAETEALLSRQVNSMAEILGQTDTSRDEHWRFPSWEAWLPIEQEEFLEIAGSAMEELGYLPLGSRNRSRSPQGVEDLVIPPLRDPLPPSLVGPAIRRIVEAHLESGILVIGGALPEDLAAREDVHHWAGGRLGALPPGRFGLVVLHSVIDQVADMDGLLAFAAQRSDADLLVLPSESTDDRAIEHSYRRNGAEGWSNQWCVARAQSLLMRNLGFGRVRRDELRTGDPWRPSLTMLHATREAAPAP